MAAKAPKTTARTSHAFEVLKDPGRVDPSGVCVVFGSDRFLRRRVRDEISRLLLGADPEMPLPVLSGKGIQWRDVNDFLNAPALFGPRVCAVIVEEAEDFVKKWRPELERLAQAPPRTATLVLEMDQWPSNTKLYGMVAEKGWSIQCCAPEIRRGRSVKTDQKALALWLVNWCAEQYGAELQRDAAQVLIELAGADCGRLDQEIAKLAVSTPQKTPIDTALVQSVVGGWKTQTTWDMLDAACSGDAQQALVQLDRLLQAGEVPIAIFGSMSWSLRRFAAATRLVEETERLGKRVKLRDIVQQAGFRSWPTGALERGEAQLKQIGRVRGARLYAELLRTDLALKGSHSSPDRARWALEMLILSLSRVLR